MHYTKFLPTICTKTAAPGETSRNSDSLHPGDSNTALLIIYLFLLPLLLTVTAVGRYSE